MISRILLFIFFIFCLSNVFISVSAPINGLGINEEYFFFKKFGIERKTHFFFSCLGILFFIILNYFLVFKNILKIAVLILQSLLNIFLFNFRYYLSQLKDRNNCILFFISISISIISIELITRFLVYKSINFANNSIVIYDRAFTNLPSDLGYNDYLSNIEFKRWVFDKQHNLGHKSRVKTNNYGFPSEFDYHKNKKKNEYRVAIIGDSLTASVTSDIKWVDELQKLANNDINLTKKNRNLTFYNFGDSGGGYRDFIRMYCFVVEYYKPDLIVTNFISDDAFRIKDSYNSVGLNTEYSDCKQIISNYEFTRENRRENSVELFQGVNILSNCEKKILAKNCTENMYLVIDENIVFIKDKILSIRKDFFKKKSAKIFIDFNYVFSVNFFKNKFNLESLKLHYLNSINKRTDDREIALNNAIDYINFLEKKKTKHVLLLNPVHSELNEKKLPLITHKIFSYLEKNRILYYNLLPEVIKLESEYKDIDKLFNIPHDGHFSNYGSQIYAKIVYKIFKENDFFD